MKPLQAVSFHTETKDAVAYYLADKGTCKVALMVTDKTVYAPTRFEEAVGPHNSALHQIGDGKALEFAVPFRRAGDDDQLGAGGSRCALKLQTSLRSALPPPGPDAKEAPLGSFRRGLFY